MKASSFLLACVLSVASLAQAAETPSRFYAAVAMTKAQTNSSTPLDSGLYQRQTDGEWKHFGPRILGIAYLAARPDNTDYLLLASSDGILRSRDAGKSWRKVTGWEVADVRKITFDAQRPELVYASTAWGPLRSTDGGEKWQTANKGLDRLYTTTLVADAKRSGRVLIGTETGLYLSNDAAASWQKAKFPEVSVLRLAQSALQPDLFLACTQGGGAWLSRDDGATWSELSAGINKANLYAAALSPDDEKLMAIGGWAVGVRVSTDGGATWADRSAGLPVKNVLVLAFDPNTKNRLWASTFEEGSYYSDDLGLTWKDGGLYGAYGSDYIFIKPSTQS